MPLQSTYSDITTTPRCSPHLFFTSYDTWNVLHHHNRHLVYIRTAQRLRLCTRC